MKHNVIEPAARIVEVLVTPVFRDGIKTSDTVGYSLSESEARKVLDIIDANWGSDS